jgi:hypothetical protein
MRPGARDHDAAGLSRRIASHPAVPLAFLLSLHKVQ